MKEIIENRSELVGYIDLEIYFQGQGHSILQTMLAKYHGKMEKYNCVVFMVYL